MLNNLKLTLDSNRKLISVECDDFRVKLNGKDNSTYRKLFKELGLEIVFSDDPVTDVIDRNNPRNLRVEDGMVTLRQE